MKYNRRYYDGYCRVCKHKRFTARLFSGTCLWCAFIGKFKGARQT